MVKTENLKPRKFKSGFTLLELLVVVGILAALVALALPFYQDYVNQSELTTAEADLQTFKKAIAMYDQLEKTMFAGSDLTPMIGKYLQDFRTFEGQTQPRDPWGNDYVINTPEGVLYSVGPNGKSESTISAEKKVAYGDDILVTWKPPFFLSGARPVNATTIEISFSRKLKANPTVTVNAAAIAADKVQRVSDSIYRLNLAAPMITTPPTTYTVKATAAISQDNKSSFDENPSDASDGSEITFTY